MWKVIKELRSLKSLPKNRADQIEWLQGLIGDLESAEDHAHDNCYSTDYVSEQIDDIKSEVERGFEDKVDDLNARIDQLEKLLTKKNVPFPKKLRSRDELRSFKLILGGI